MGRKWCFDLVDVGECFSQGGSSEEQERLGTSPIEEERRQSSTSEERLVLQLNKATIQQNVFLVTKKFVTKSPVFRR